MEAAAATVVRHEELAARSRTGDRQAFVTLYEPDFGGVFDFVLRTVRDSELAASALRASLERAWDVFYEQGAPFDVTAWLYSLARDEVLGCPVKRRPRVAEREAFDYTQVETDRLSEPFVGFDKNLMELVWDAATALGRDDYSLLDLHVRRDLSVNELAENVGLSRDDLAARLSQLCDSLNEDVGTMLLATRARHNCDGLDADLSAADANVRRAVRRHARVCAQCRETKQRFVPATEVLGSFAFVTPPPGLRERTANAFLAPARRPRWKTR
jgi:DNA-directed RNA polymerase specialized sigma24 family protein